MQRVLERMEWEKGKESSDHVVRREVRNEVEEVSQRHVYSLSTMASRFHRRWLRVCGVSSPSLSPSDYYKVKLNRISDRER